LKPEQWGSPLVQEKYPEEKACDKRHPYRIIIIIIIIRRKRRRRRSKRIRIVDMLQNTIGLIYSTI